MLPPTGLKSYQSPRRSWPTATFLLALPARMLCLERWEDGLTTAENDPPHYSALPSERQPRETAPGADGRLAAASVQWVYGPLRGGCQQVAGNAVLRPALRMQQRVEVSAAPRLVSPGHSRQLAADLMELSTTE